MTTHLLGPKGWESSLTGVARQPEMSSAWEPVGVKSTHWVGHYDIMFPEYVAF